MRGDTAAALTGRHRISFTLGRRHYRRRNPLAGMGFITELLSKPIRCGYMNGIALTVLISQLPKVFEFSIDSDGPATNLLHIFNAIIDGLTHGTTFIIGTATLLIILLLKRYPPFPGILLAVIGATVIVGRI